MAGWQVGMGRSPCLAKSKNKINGFRHSGIQESGIATDSRREKREDLFGPAFDFSRSLYTSAAENNANKASKAAKAINCFIYVPVYQHSIICTRTR